MGATILTSLFAFSLACACAETNARAEDTTGSRYLYVWAWDFDERDSDFLSVLDVDPASPSYGEVLSSIAVGVVGGAHHTEHVMGASDRLFVNAFAAGRTFVMDVSNPLAPRVASSFTTAGGYAFPHSFERTPSGTVLATFQAKANSRAEPGGLVELDALGNFIRGADAANPIDPELRPYSLTLLPRLDRVLTTSADMTGDKQGNRFKCGGSSTSRSFIPCFFLEPREATNTFIRAKRGCWGMGNPSS